MKGEKPWVVIPDDVRPARPDGRCFYCMQPLGAEHESNCVIRNRTCVIDFTIRLVTNEVEDWTPEDIEDWYNRGSWCFDNLLGRINDYRERSGHCLCNISSAKFVREATPEDEASQKLFIEEAHPHEQI